MSFYTSKSGAKIDGSPENSHISTFNRVIPDNTQAPALLKAIELKRFDDGGEVYNVTWKLLEGDCKNWEVWQKINPFDPDPKRADRAMNMLVRLMKLCNFAPSHKGQPSTEDLQPMVGSMVGILVRQWAKDGKEGNFISEIHPLDGQFQTVNGVLAAQISTPAVDSALTRNAQSKTASLKDDDIPW